MPRLETLHECLHSIKQCITTIQSFEPAAWPTFPFAVMGHMSHSLQMLYRLSALDSEPDWDAAAVRRDFDVIAVIHRVADTMSRVADAAGLTGDPESGPYGVRANAVCPGFIETSLGEAFFAQRDDPEKARKRMEAQYPLKRLGKPEEVADAIAYLASDEASYVTGHGLVLDGGYSIS